MREGRVCSSVLRQHRANCDLTMLEANLWGEIFARRLISLVFEFSERALIACRKLDARDLFASKLRVYDGVSSTFHVELQFQEMKSLWQKEKISSGYWGYYFKGELAWNNIKGLVFLEAAKSLPLFSRLMSHFANVLVPFLRIICLRKEIFLNVCLIPFLLFFWVWQLFS